MGEQVLCQEVQRAGLWGPLQSLFLCGTGHLLGEGGAVCALTPMSRQIPVPQPGQTRSDVWGLQSDPFTQHPLPRACFVPGPGLQGVTLRPIGHSCPSRCRGGQRQVPGGRGCGWYGVLWEVFPTLSDTPVGTCQVHVIPRPLREGSDVPGKEHLRAFTGCTLAPLHRGVGSDMRQLPEGLSWEEAAGWPSWQLP